MLRFTIQSASAVFILLFLQNDTASSTCCWAAFVPPSTTATPPVIQRPTITTTTKMHSHFLSSRPRRTIKQQISMSPTDREDSLVLDGGDDRNDDDDDSDSDDEAFTIDGPEKSLMTNYISQFLLREAAAQQQESPMASSAAAAAATEKRPIVELRSSDSDDVSHFTHLVAIPMDNCHELLLELESIQRAILYHCPVLVHASIPQATTRLPLLYVQCTSTSAATASATSSSAVMETRRLSDMVQEVMQQYGFLPNKPKKYNDGHGGGIGDDDGDDLPNDFHRRVEKNTNDDNDGVTAAPPVLPQPLMLNFSTLEVDGNTNQVLQTVAKETDAATRRLQQMVHDLQSLIQQQEPSWKTMLPPDPHHRPSTTATPTTSTTTSNVVFRPRIPFMRLPRDWDDIIRQQYKREKQQQQGSTNSNSDDDDDDDEDHLFLTSDQGGNGISPIFWCQWWHDEFPESRMREVAIYRRQQLQPQLKPKAAASASAAAGNGDGDHDDLNEQTFYMPERSIPLPMGKEAWTKQENTFQDYQEQRMLEAEGLQAQQQDDDDDFADILQQEKQKQQDENDPLFVKTRSRLESLYQQSSSYWEDNDVPQTKTDGNDRKSEPTIVDAQVVNPNKGESPRSEQLKKKQKSTGDDDDNLDDSSSSGNILDDWTLERIRKTVASRAKVQSEKELARKKDNLPPIAENNIFTKYKQGTLVPEQDQVKQELTTPRELPPFPSREHCLGFWRVLKSPTGFDVEEDDSDSTRSENLVLCVDGTVAGGPILDQETRQKASGGTWRLSATSTYDATLRIRLVIPPKKDRILVMEGKLNRLSSSLSGSSFSMPSSTFSIPALEEKKTKANQESSEMLTCQGEVWLEDAVTGYNRKDVGTFSLMKLETPSDPKSYTITVPRPVRNQD